ncbi:MAG: hypothetical protein IMZ53_01175 [Thermoplasmata archaeon]|nr:hypothetical protein [Thermoplasmata archaeon]
MKDPAFPLYTQDFLVGTMFFTDEETGVYIRLLAIQHQHGGLIDKETFNKKIKKYPNVKSKFTETEDGFYNHRLMAEMVKRQKKSNNLSLNALKRWGMQKHSNCIASAMQHDSDNENESICTKDIEEMKMRVDLEQHLLECWGRDGRQSSYVITGFVDLIRTYGRDKVLSAIEESAKQNKKSLAYVIGILEKRGTKKVDSKTKMERAFETQKALQEKEKTNV